MVMTEILGQLGLLLLSFITFFVFFITPKEDDVTDKTKETGED